MRLHREGRKLLSYWLVIAVLITLTVYVSLENSPRLQFALYATTAFSILALTWFFRFPGRAFGNERETAYSPVDGKIVVIEDVFEDEYFRDRRRQVSIFMSVTDPHVNYAPIRGQVDYFKYHPGKYLLAYHPKSSALNERTTIALIGESGKGLVMRQIAGAVARRIVWYCEEGQSFEPGEQIGFIKFGSRIDLLLPADASIEVSIGQKVRAGQSIARL